MNAQSFDHLRGQMSSERRVRNERRAQEILNNNTQLHFDLPKCIDHTLLKIQATEDDYKRLADEAIQYNMHSIVILPNHVRFMAGLLINTDINTCAVIGFPLANIPRTALRGIASYAIDEGASELDMCISLAGNESQIASEISTVKEVINETIIDFNLNEDLFTLKVIIEANLFDRKRLEGLCRIIHQEGADFVKTNSGFISHQGVTTEEVKQLKDIVGDSLKIKAASGVTSVAQAIDLIAAGADRIGTSSGAQIAKEWLEIKT